VAYTNEVIAFAQPNEDGLLETIPLSEVIEIESMQNMDKEDMEQQQSKSTFGNTVDFTHALQIRTDKQGQNAGRKYYLRADSEEAAAAIIASLSKLAKVARKTAAAETRWEKIRSSVRKIYDSSVFQGVAAFLIIGVSMAAGLVSPGEALSCTSTRAAASPPPCAHSPTHFHGHPAMRASAHRHGSSREHALPSSADPPRNDHTAKLKGDGRESGVGREDRAGDWGLGGSGVGWVARGGVPST
jgi:hypothetical protein